ncbi:hypothetical protein NDU88_001538 [Pleurodeles waltl]|uniref:Uncharacterized protein n=1 Tax=Pleurodeles waltl TaxID=8319 RepID=A0AAV7KPU8_PLEWA|nr:hypothetical protein NDU88_001538 [Pleurodeles waltl]
MGGHSPLEQEDGGGPAGDGLPTWERCPSHHDPPDVQDPGGGVSGVEWALEGITAATRGDNIGGPVVPVVNGFWSAPGSRAASVARSHNTDSPPPVKQQKLASARLERGKTPATKAAPRGTVGSVESAATPSKVGEGHKKTGKSGKFSTVEKTAISPAAKEPTASSPTAPDRTAISPLPRSRPPVAPLPQTGPPSARCQGADRQQQPRCPRQDRQQQPRCQGADHHQPHCPRQDCHQPRCQGADHQQQPRCPRQDHQQQPRCTRQDHQQQPRCPRQDRHQQPRCPRQDRQQQPRCPRQDRQQQPRCQGADRQQQPCCPRQDRQQLNRCQRHRRNKHRRPMSAKSSDATEAATSRMKHSGHKAPSRTSGERHPLPLSLAG